MDDDTDVGDVDGIDSSTAEKLRNSGYETFGDLRGVDRSALFDVDGIGAKRASQVLSAVEEATEARADGDDSGGEADEDAEDGEADDGASNGGSTAEESTEDDGAGGDPDGDDAGASVSIVDVRDAARTTTADLIGHDLDGVIQVTDDGEGWLAVVEVVERHSVPDTQDILGRYELSLDERARVTGYQRVGRYRRSDSDVDEY